MHPGMILVNNQLDAQFFMCVYFYSLHVSGNYVSIIRRIIVSMWHLVYVTLCRWPSAISHVPIIRRIIVSMWHLVYVTLCRWPSAISHVPIIRRIIVSMWQLVYVTLCRWPSVMQVNLHNRRSSTQSDINQLPHWYNNSPDDGHMTARNM